MGRDVLSFPTDVSARRPIQRARSRVIDDIVRYQADANQSQFEAAEKFYKTTLAQGILEFRMIDPDTRKAATFQFTSAPTYEFLGAGYRRMTWSLVRWG